MEKNYAYPLNVSWSTDETASVLHFLTQVEKAYEGGVAARDVLDAYRVFKQIVPSKGEERQIGRDFEKVSGYSAYRVVQAAKTQEKGQIRLGS